MAKASFKDKLAQKTKNALGSSTISLAAIKQQIRVLDELRAFIPPPLVEEYSQLEKNIVQNGCKDALVVWETTERQLDENTTITGPAYVLVDGHNRFKICVENELPFTIQLMPFASLADVKDYMIDLQLGRRNLAPQQASYFRGLRYQNEKLDKGKYDRDDHKVHGEPYGSTAEKLARAFNVSASTIKRDARLAEGLNRLDKKLRNEVLAGELKVGKNEIRALVNLPESAPAVKDITTLRHPVLPNEATNGPTQPTVDEVVTLLRNSVRKLARSKDRQELATIKKHVQLLEKMLGKA